MKYIVYTGSGAVHEVDTEQLTYRRWRAGTPRPGLNLAELRRDGGQLRLLQSPAPPVVGQGWELLLEPLAEEALVTVRTTTPVVGIEIVE